MNVSQNKTVKMEKFSLYISSHEKDVEFKNKFLKDLSRLNELFQVTIIEDDL